MYKPAVMTALGALAISAAACAAALGLMLRFPQGLPLDLPNDRSLHTRPTPRVGGIALLIGLAAAGGTGFAPVALAPVALSLGLAATLAAISLLDDIHRVPTLVRLVVHVGSAAAIVWFLFAPIDPWVYVLLMLAVIWLTNLYNFMDGADGLAGGMAVIGFGCYAVAALLAGDTPTAALSAAIVGGSAAFLAFNFPPARVFLGDVGSVPLGFLAAAIGLLGWKNQDWPLWFPLLAFGPFIGDATATLLRRAVDRERVWRAHREHFYQRMVRMGLGHRRTALAGYAAMLVCAGAAFYGLTLSGAEQIWVFAAATAFLGACALVVDVLWARHLRAGPPA